MATPRTTCALYTWGANSFGQLGQGHAEDQAEPQCVDDGQERQRLRAITGGGGHSALITETGELLVCGQNHKGQLGLGHISDVTNFQHCPLPGNQTVQQVSCGWDFTILLTDNGHVLACGSNAFGQLGVSAEIKHTAEPLLIKSLSEPVISVATGLRHALAVTGSGGVHQWGTGLSAQAKRALNPQPVPVHLACKEPHLVPGLDQVTCQKVVAGSAHSACLTVAGDIFLWGSNKYGQLCNKESFLPLPTALDGSLLKGERVCAIHSGWTHLIAQTETGRVFTWGRASYGQLGRRGQTNDVTSPESDASLADSSSEISLPSEVKTLNGATQIACGSEHNLAVVGNQVFSWGWNEHGMCGHGSFCDITQPQPIPALKDVRTLLIGCGAGHSMALCCLKSGGESGS
ncbi:secretion-regulating guanine nucleotide exchange factor isoform X1 [Pygocentrus nattereri]|uniref:RCC1-like domain-containing protein n=1 Tax=Pygocentrus nattereri TaxID=42514 RepID=A0A3B4BQE3_PYGNA|nr:secretion-regulating guanine nucleotide exchange factor isoform X1 [Pygocentrus nattereri]